MSSLGPHCGREEGPSFVAAEWLAVQLNAKPQLLLLGISSVAIDLLGFALRSSHDSMSFQIGFSFKLGEMCVCVCV